MITFITPRIAIGDSVDARRVKSPDFETTLNVAFDLDIEDSRLYELNPVRRHKVGLIDGPGNPPSRLVAAVVLLHSLTQDSLRVLVHCHAGRSRSVMVCALYLAATTAVPLEQVLSKVMAQRGVTEYQRALLEAASRALPLARRTLSELGNL